MKTTTEAKKLYAREPLSRIIAKDIRPESFVYEVTTDSMHNNTVDAILKGDLITVSKSCLNEIKPEKQYVVTDKGGNILLGYLELDTPNQSLYIKPLGNSYHLTTLKFDQILTIEVIYLLDRMINESARLADVDSIIFEPKRDELTQNEYDSLKGLALFVKSDNPYAHNSDKETYTGHPYTFILRMQTLLNSLDSFLIGRFKCDGHLDNLYMAYTDAIKVRPHMADKYFYAYAQIMELMVIIFNQEPLIAHFSGVMENLAEKHEFFQIAKTAPANQLSN